MKFGLRTPSLKRRIAARTSWKRGVRHSIGLKAPRGMGFITNPKRAVYNRVYNRTSFSIDGLLKANKKKSSSSATSVKIGGSFWIDLVIFVILAVSFFPLAIVFLLYKLYKSKKSKQTQILTSDNALKENQLAVLPQNDGNSSLFSQLHIPEPTKSLLWITDEDVSKITGPMSFTISVDLDKRNINTADTSYNFFSEPSLIWTKLPIEKNSELETQKMYFPVYAKLFPKNRYQYLSWLCDISQKTNLSYIFLYFYGLERHLLVGNYDAAVDEILRLLEYHDERSLKNYAINSLIAASGFRKRPDIVVKAPFLLEQTGNESLLLTRSAGKTIQAAQVIALASRVGFTNKRYINEEPKMFFKELQSAIYEYEAKNGNILKSVNIDVLPKKPYPIIANISIPAEIRTFKLPQIIEDMSLQSVLKSLLIQTHEKVKEQLKLNPK